MERKCETCGDSMINLKAAQYNRVCLSCWEKGDFKTNNKKLKGNHIFRFGKNSPFYKEFYKS